MAVVVVRRARGTVVVVDAVEAAATAVDIAVVEAGISVAATCASCCCR
jgi:hypothetical protein